MSIHEQIRNYIESQPDQKARELQELHDMILGLMPGCRVWYLDGRDESGRTVSNPSIGFGVQTMKYASGKTRDFYQVGFSSNTTGISVYIMGIKDKQYLAKAFGHRLGKASVTGYCIKFRTLRDIDCDALVEAIRYGAEQTRG